MTRGLLIIVVLVLLPWFIWMSWEWLRRPRTKKRK